MKRGRRVNVRLRTRTVILTLPVPRLECPVCNTLDRIQKLEREPGFQSLIRRGGTTGSCGDCCTRYDAEVLDNPKRFRYVAVHLEKIVKDQLANYWIVHRKTPIPTILQLEETK